MVKAMTQNEVSRELFFTVVFFPSVMKSNTLIFLSTLILLTAVMTLRRCCQRMKDNNY